MNLLVPFPIRGKLFILLCILFSMSCHVRQRDSFLLNDNHDSDNIVVTESGQQLTCGERLRKLIKEHGMDDPSQVITYLKSLPKETRDRILNKRCSDGMTVLLLAAVHGSTEIFDCLLDYGADYQVTDRASNNILHLLARRQDPEALRIVKSFMERFRAECIALASASNNVGYLPCHSAIVAGDKEDLFLSLALEAYRGGEVHPMDITNPHHFLLNGEPSLCLAAEYNRKKIFRLLLSMALGGDLTGTTIGSKIREMLVKNNWLSFNPLRPGGRISQAELTQCLSRRDSRGNTPLHYSIAHPQGEEITDLLLLTPIDPNVPNAAGNTALHTAMMCGSGVIKRLLTTKYGIPFGLSPTAIYPSVNLYSVNRLGETPFMLAVKHGGEEAVKLICSLQKYDRNPEISLEESLTQALVFTIQDEDVKMFKCLLSEMAEWIGFFKNIRLQNQHGNTLLHLAAEGGNIPIVNLLLEKGFDKNIKNRLGETPIELTKSPAVKFLLAI